MASSASRFTMCFRPRVVLGKAVLAWFGPAVFFVLLLEQTAAHSLDLLHLIESMVTCKGWNGQPQRKPGAILEDALGRLFQLEKLLHQIGQGCTNALFASYCAPWGIKKPLIGLVTTWNHHTRNHSCAMPFPRCFSSILFEICYLSSRGMDWVISSSTSACADDTLFEATSPRGFPENGKCTPEKWGSDLQNKKAARLV